MNETTLITALKNCSYVVAFLIGLSLQSYIILAAFMLMDILTGIIRTWVVHGGKSIKSYRLVAGITSKMLVLAVPLLVAYAGKGTGVDMLLVAKGALGVLIFAHLYSILGNIHSINIGKDIAEFDAVNFILRKLRDLIERQLKNEKFQE